MRVTGVVLTLTAILVANVSVAEEVDHKLIAAG